MGIFERFSTKQFNNKRIFARKLIAKLSERLQDAINGQKVPSNEIVQLMREEFNLPKELPIPVKSIRQNPYFVINNYDKLKSGAANNPVAAIKSIQEQKEQLLNQIAGNTKKINLNENDNALMQGPIDIRFKEWVNEIGYQSGRVPLQSVYDWYTHARPNLSLLTQEEAEKNTANWHENIHKNPKVSNLEVYPIGKLGNQTVAPVIEENGKEIQLPAMSMVSVHSNIGLVEEGDKMGHCVGGYADQVKDGETEIYSLRDANNEPHATMQVTGDKIWQIKGKGDLRPSKYYPIYVRTWAEENNLQISGDKQNAHTKEELLKTINNLEDIERNPFSHAERIMGELYEVTGNDIYFNEQEENEGVEDVKNALKNIVNYAIYTDNVELAMYFTEDNQYSINKEWVSEWVGENKIFELENIIKQHGTSSQKEQQFDDKFTIEYQENNDLHSLATGGKWVNDEDYDNLHNNVLYLIEQYTDDGNVNTLIGSTFDRMKGYNYTDETYPKMFSPEFLAKSFLIAYAKKNKLNPNQLNQTSLSDILKNIHSVDGDLLDDIFDEETTDEEMKEVIKKGYYQSQVENAIRNNNYSQLAKLKNTADLLKTQDMLIRHINNRVENDSMKSKMALAMAQWDYADMNVLEDYILPEDEAAFEKVKKQYLFTPSDKDEMIKKTLKKTRKKKEK